MTVRNVGGRDAYEVVQLYVGKADSALPRPKKELKGFKKIFLRAGESATVSFPLSPSAFAVRSGEPDFLIALFSATSATCVTGHTVIDPYTYFTGFGQAVMLVLIQIGGLGFITIISLFMLYIKKDVTLSDRKLAMQSAGGLKMAGLKGLLKYIFIGTFSLEFLGAVLLAITALITESKNA